LRDGAHHAVEDDALGGFRLGQLLAHHAQNDIVVHQVAGLHHRLGLEAERRPPLHRVPQQIARGELG
jgi:hypothetical protein